MRIRPAILSILSPALLAASCATSHAANTSYERAPRVRPQRTGGGIVWRREDYKDFVTRGMYRPVFIRRELALSKEEFWRAERLLHSGIVRTLLLKNCVVAGTLFSVEKLSRRVLIAGDAEFVVSLRTMIEDSTAFLLAAPEDRSGNALAVVSLVDPLFLEANPTLAFDIAEDSYEGVKRILKPQTEDYRRAGKRLRFCEELGTVAILDRPEKIGQVKEYLGLRPYAPRPETY